MESKGEDIPGPGAREPRGVLDGPQNHEDDNTGPYAVLWIIFAAVVVALLFFAMVVVVILVKRCLKRKRPGYELQIDSEERVEQGEHADLDLRRDGVRSHVSTRPTGEITRSVKRVEPAGNEFEDVQQDEVQSGVSTNEYREDTLSADRAEVYEFEDAEKDDGVSTDEYRELTRSAKRAIVENDIQKDGVRPRVSTRHVSERPWTLQGDSALSGSLVRQRLGQTNRSTNYD